MSERIDELAKLGASLERGDRLAEADVIVNGILQDPLDPVMFFAEGDEHGLRHGSLIVDVSCDLAMGFPFARPTSFEEPTFPVGPVTYYAVDHSPSYLYNTASLEHSKEAHVYAGDVLGGEDAWRDCPTVGKAVEIRAGQVINPKILSFQGRERAYPHRRLGSGLRPVNGGGPACQLQSIS